MLTLTAAPWSSSSLGVPRIRNQAFFVANPTRFQVVVSHKHTKNSQFLEEHRSSRSFRRTSRCFLMDVVVRSGVEPGHIPSDGSPGSWKLWILGMVISVVLPFWRSKWGPLLKLKNEVETVVNMVEDVAEAMEAVAEKVEEVADEVGNHLPEGQLKAALEIVEDVADEIGKDAHIVDSFIEKVEQVENNMEKEVETITGFGPVLKQSATAEPAMTYQEATEPALDQPAAIKPAKESVDQI